MSADVMYPSTILFLALIVAQRLSELVIAKRNTTRLLARGATEYGAAHYPFMVALHTAWVACLIGFGHDAPIRWGWFSLFVLLQCARVWILMTLGPRWTTRIIVLDEPLVARGPFRVLGHPNYTLVVFEIFIAPMALGLLWVGVLFTILNAAMLLVRIRSENAALAALRAGGAPVPGPRAADGPKVP